MRLAERRDRVVVLLRELDGLEVRDEAFRPHRLRDDAVPAVRSPCEEDLRGGGAELLRDELDERLFGEERDADGVVAERAVGGDVYADFVAVFDELVLGKEWVRFDLVGGLIER